MNTIGYFEIQSSQPDREIIFYQSVFGWKFIREPHVPIPYYRIETAGIAGGLLERPAAIPPPMAGTNAFTCSIEVTDFDATAEIISRAGGKIAMPKFAVPGRCWQGYFMDQDKNVFGLFQVDPNAR
jgi:hypothetical protein